MTAVEPVISVILPVYNARIYLPFTMKNIVDDQFSTMRPEQWELIAVDDGSTDGSHLEIEPWAERYPGSVRLLRTPNRGVSATRNTGLAAARGRYVYFIDSDDILLRNALPSLLQLSLRDGEPDAIKFLFRQISTGEYEATRDRVPDANLTAGDISLVSARDFMNETFGLSHPMIHTSTWQTIYRREVLTRNGVTFSEQLTVGEDEVFTWNAMAHIGSVAYTPAELYMYHQRAGSISHATDPEQEERFQMNRIKFCGTMISVLNNDALTALMEPDVLQNTRRNYLFGYYRSIIELTVNGFPLSAIRRAMKLYKSYGGDVHPGRPRFTPFYNKSEMPMRVKLRRMVVAYGLGTLTKLGF